MTSKGPGHFLSLLPGAARWTFPAALSLLHSARLLNCSAPRGQDLQMGRVVKAKGSELRGTWPWL